MNRRDFLKLFGALPFVGLAAKFGLDKKKQEQTQAESCSNNENMTHDYGFVRVWITTPDNRAPQLLGDGKLKIERPHC